MNDNQWANEKQHILLIHFDSVSLEILQLTYLLSRFLLQTFLYLLSIVDGNYHLN